MIGSIRRRKTGRGIRFQARPPQGAAKTFATRADAERWLRDHAVRREAGGPVEAAKITTGDLLHLWLRPIQVRVATTTFASYDETVRVHLEPELGAILVGRLGPAAIQQYISDKLASGLSPTSVRYQVTRLGQALRWGLKQGYLLRDPMPLVELPARRRIEMRVWDVEQARLFLGAAARSSRHYALYLTALGIGARLGELLALRWRHVDLVMGTVRIEQTFSRLVRQGQLWRPPKTQASRRTIEIAPNIVAALQELPGPHRDDDLVFCQPDGKPHHAHNLTQRDFPRTIRRAGVPKIRFHDLRHTCATLMLKGGVHPKIVSQMLGHTTVRMTLDTYSHVLPGMSREAIHRLGHLLDGRED
jgi:integrase